MEHWEHKIYLCTEFIDLEQLIRSCGKDGWQLVSVVECHSGQWAGFLKRKVS